MCAWWLQSDWWTAIGTLLLVVVTIGAVIVGGRAANIALSALKLESEPVLVLSDPGIPPNRSVEIVAGRIITVRDPNHWYVVSVLVDEHGKKSLSFHRARDGEINKLQTSPPGSYLEIKNVGRSPAVGVTVRINVEAETLNIDGTEPTLANIEGSGNLVLHALGPNSSEYIGISNKLGVPVKVFPETWGTRSLWNDPARKTRGDVKKAPIAVMSMVFVFKPFSEPVV